MLLAISLVTIKDSNQQTIPIPLEQFPTRLQAQRTKKTKITGLDILEC